MEEWLNPSALGSLAAILVSLVTAAVTIAKEKRAAPIDRKTAEMATTTAIAAASKTTIEAAMAVNEKLDAESDRKTEEINKMHKALAEEQSKVDLWHQWYAMLVSQWEVLRRYPHPPLQPNYVRKDS